ncbi:hypothetical protein HUK80_09875 [Flavobacterium sp. MAH-1]|uniref:YD repeat-containing protein n=1 Tax=Flavobacterium agri TaxID=2743471 RepID=A0A7Y8Y2E0_9FLAO|nr:hypothetical protein [Flavobacterium agri]NUY81202.1 hypothetical protein [Flavobacterium agri]NYA71226.1 hypothetical protein [Flavobacterium agri]
MKKVFLFLMASMALVSCGSDDGGGAKRPSMVALAGGSESLVYNMTYDSKGRLNTLTSSQSGSHTYTFAYNESGKVASATASGSITGVIGFAYNEDGKLSTVTRTGEEPTTVTWIDATTATVGTTTVKLDAKGDLQLYDTASFTRDTGKGAFASVKGVDGLTLLFIEQQTLFFASKKPAKTISGSGVAYIMNNDFEGGMISGATFDANGTPYTMTITY